MAEQEGMAAEGQAEGQALAAATDGQQGAESVQPQDDGQYVRIPRSNYAKLAPDGDFNKVVHMANQFQEMDRGGFVQLAARAGEMNMDGFLLAHALMTPEEDRTGAEQQAVEQAGQQVQQQAAQQGQYLTEAQVDQRVAQQMEKYTQTQTQQSQRQQAVSTEQAAYQDALREMGYESKPQDFDLGGTTTKLDPTVDLIYRQALEGMVQKLMDSRLNRNDPNYATKRFDPAPPELVREAANILKPILATLGQQAQLEQAEVTASMPSGSVAAGPSGRAQKNVEDMTADEQKAAALARAEKRGVFKR